MVEAHAYQLSHRVGDLVVIEDATAHWYETDYLPAVRAVHDAGLPDAHRHQTKGDIYCGCSTSAASCRPRTAVRPGLMLCAPPAETACPAGSSKR